MMFTCGTVGVLELDDGVGVEMASDGLSLGLLTNDLRLKIFMGYGEDWRRERKRKETSGRKQGVNTRRDSKWGTRTHHQKPFRPRGIFSTCSAMWQRQSLRQFQV